MNTAAQEPEEWICGTSLNDTARLWWFHLRAERARSVAELDALFVERYAKICGETVDQPAAPEPAFRGPVIETRRVRTSTETVTLHAPTGAGYGMPEGWREWARVRRWHVTSEDPWPRLPMRQSRRAGPGVRIVRRK